MKTIFFTFLVSIFTYSPCISHKHSGSCASAPEVHLCRTSSSGTTCYEVSTDSGTWGKKTLSKIQHGS